MPFLNVNLWQDCRCQVISLWHLTSHLCPPAFLFTLPVSSLLSWPQWLLDISRKQLFLVSSLYLILLLPPCYCLAPWLRAKWKDMGVTYCAAFAALASLHPALSRCNWAGPSHLCETWWLTGSVVWLHGPLLGLSSASSGVPQGLPPRWFGQERLWGGMWKVDVP